MSQSFRINTNIGALSAYSALTKLNAQSQKAQLRIASQKRINNVADDTSGFNVGKSLDSKVRIMESAQRNVGSAQDMLATAESQLISIKDMLTGIRAKIADASNPVSDNAAIAKDIQAIADELFSAFSSTKFNNTSLLQSVTNGAGAGFTFQTGVSSSDSIDIDYGNVSGKELVGDASTTAFGESSFNIDDYWDPSADGGSGASIDPDSGLYILQDQNGTWMTYTKDRGSFSEVSEWWSTHTLEDYAFEEGTVWDYFDEGNNATTSSGDISGLSSAVATALDSLKNVTSGTISSLSLDGLEDSIDASLGSIGNYSQRLDSKQEFLTSAISNSKSAYSRLFDADMGLEQLNATKAQIGSQAATSMFSQMNFAPQGVLQLFS